MAGSATWTNIGTGVSRRAAVRYIAGLSASATGLVLLGGCGVMTSPVSGPAKVRRIGYLSGSSLAATRPYVDVFLDGLRELGWLEGENLSIEWRFTDGRNELLSELAADLVRASVEIIVAVSSQPTRAVQQQTSTLPIVMLGAPDPVGLGLVASLARPGGNTTGTAATLGSGIYSKGLELFKQVVPGLTRLVLMADKSNPLVPSVLGTVQETAQALALHVLELDVRSAADLEGAFAAATGWAADGLLFHYEPGFGPVIRRIVELAAQRHLPGSYTFRDFVEAGGLLAYVANLRPVFRRTAIYVDKILKGARPADLPIEQPTSFEFVLNLKTAQALELTIPADVATQVTEWIQ